MLNFFKRFSLKDYTLFLLLIILCVTAFSEVVGRLSYELKEIANWDTGLYYTVGKGIVNGISPYSGLYENKPPMIFLLSAMSYKVTGGFYLVNLINSFFFLVILLGPAITFVIHGIKNKSRSHFYMALTAFAMSTLFMCYAELRSGEVQIEAMGAAALILCFCTMSFIYGKEVKLYNKYVIASGIFLGMATMFKEPFGFIGAVCLLFFIKNPKDLLTKFAMPIAYCFGFAFFILLCSGGFIPYFTVYWANMFGSHISVYGSPFDRAKNVFRLFDDMRGYSHCLEAAIISLLTLNGLLCFSNNPNSKKRNQIFTVVFRVARLALLVWTASFMVGLGGPYYNHHHIFALPCYIVLLLSILLEKPEISECSSQGELSKKIYFALAVCSSILAIICFYNREEYTEDKNVPKAIEKAKAGAKYVDKILDAIGEENYLFLGFNGHEFFAYTKHLPIGPAFAQWPNNFESEDTYFAKNFEAQMAKANVIIFKNYNTGAITDKVIRTVDNCFTREFPEAAKGIKRPSGFRYNIHFRSKQDCSFFDK